MTSELLEPSVGADALPEVDRLVRRLNEPQVAASLNLLLDNVELVAVLVAGLDGLARKGEVIGDTIGEFIGQLRAATQDSGLNAKETAEQLGTILPTLAAASPAINRILESPIVAPEPIDILSETAVALVDGLRAAEAGETRLGFWGLMRATRDKDVQRGLGFLVEVARVFGRDLGNRAATPATEPST